MRSAQLFRLSSIVVLVVVLVLFGCASQRAAQQRELGAGYLNQGDLVQARQAYEQSLAEEDNALAHAQLGHILAKQDLCLDALPHLQAGLSAPDGLRRVRLDLAACHMKLQNWGEAAEQFLLVIEDDPADSTTAVQSADLWPNLDNDPRLEGWLERMVKAQPNNHYGWAYTGNHFYRQGKWKEASYCYRKALEIFPTSSPVLIRFAAAESRQGNLELSEKLYLKALQLEDSSSARFGLAGVLFLKKQYPESLEQLATLLKAQPDNPQALALACQLHYMLGDRAAALQAGIKALEKLGDNLALLRLVAGLAFDEKDYAKAAEYYHRLIGINEKDAVAYQRLGVCQAKLGQANNAQQSLVRAIMIDPKMAVAHRELGRLYRDYKQSAPALAELSEAVRLDPNDGEAQLLYGLTLFDQGQASYAKAEAPLLAAVERLPDNPISYSRLAVISISKRYFSEGLSRLEQAVEMGFDDLAFLEGPGFLKVKYGPRFLAVKQRLEQKLNEAEVPPLAPIQLVAP